MSLPRALTERREEILDAWIDRILGTYPPEAARFLRREKDPFRNPVGAGIARESRALYDALLAGASPEDLTPVLDGIVRIRAVQSFTPSEAVSFLVLLKDVVREILEEELGVRALRPFEARVDRAVLLAFDVYMACREQMYEIRARQARRETYTLLERVGMIPGFPEPGEECSESGDEERGTGR